MSVQYWRNKGESRTRIIALDGGYHGETFGAMSAGARSIFLHTLTISYLLLITFHFPVTEKNVWHILNLNLRRGE